MKSPRAPSNVIESRNQQWLLEISEERGTSKISTDEKHIILTRQSTDRGPLAPPNHHGGS
jgi:hypothetical protein